MYVIYNNQKYECKRHKVSKYIAIYKGLPNDFPSTVEGEIAIYDDYYTLLDIVNTADYLRQEFSNGILILHKLPEPIEPESTFNARIDELEKENVELVAAIEKGLNL